MFVCENQNENKLNIFTLWGVICSTNFDIFKVNASGRFSVSVLTLYLLKIFALYFFHVKFSIWEIMPFSDFDCFTRITVDWPIYASYDVLWYTLRMRGWCLISIFIPNEWEFSFDVVRISVSDRHVDVFTNLIWFQTGGGEERLRIVRTFHCLFDRKANLST